VLYVARWKCRTQKIAKNSPSGHHRTTSLGYIFTIKARIDNRKKIVKQRCLPHMSSQYGELQATSGWDLLASLGHPSKFQPVSRLGSITVRHSSSGRQPKFVVLNTGRHLHSEGRPSRWALAHILGCENIARQSCVMVPKRQIFGDFSGPAFLASRMQHISDLHSKFALGPHHV